ncbi:MAG TPA: hypothetical protein VN253_19835, partial [Kofleriaceae bacterium]|nr:hypothetical protein [Kofleriaceae bacterium]
ALAAAGACDRRPPLASCDDDLRGVYVADGQRWMILDGRDALEVYPLFDDVTPARSAGGPDAELEVAPRMISLRRTPGGVAGEVRRRYMRGTRVCLAKVPARLTACAGDAIELVVSDPAPPLAWERPCLWPRPGSSRRERWIRIDR